MHIFNSDLKLFSMRSLAKWVLGINLMVYFVHGGREESACAWRLSSLLGILKSHVWFASLLPGPCSLVLFSACLLCMWALLILLPSIRIQVVPGDWPPQITNLSLGLLNDRKYLIFLWVDCILPCAVSICGLPAFQPSFLDSALELEPHETCGFCLDIYT